jgi:hypothetical protein
MVSMMMAILLAFALNVDAIRLFKAFLTDQQLTARVLAEADSITAIFEKQQVAQPPLAAAPLPTPTPETVSAPSPDEPAAGAIPDEQPPPQSPALSATNTGTENPAASDAEAANSTDVKAIQEKITFLNEQIAASTALGLPIGPAYYPWCLDEVPGPICKDRLTLDGFRTVSITSLSVTRFVRWFVSVFLAGVLIGLGGPFWFSAFSNLSAIVRLLGGPSKQANTDAKDPAAAAQSPTIEAPPPRTAGEAFVAMAEAAAPKPPQGRILLTPHGRRR